MIVVDASVIVDFLLDIQPQAERIAGRIRRESLAVIAPHLIDAEVAQVVRRHVLRGDLTGEQGAEVVQLLAELPVTRYPHGPLLQRALALRENATVYDALYIALAEATDATLLTRDKALAQVPGCAARVEVLE